MFGKKIKCMYCGKKIKESAICPLCEREQKPMISIEELEFNEISRSEMEEFISKKPGFLEKKIHAEMVDAVSSGRIRIAEAMADGIYYEERVESDNEKVICKRQLIQSMTGIPIEGKFYSGTHFHVVGDEIIVETYYEDEEDDYEEDDYEDVLEEETFSEKLYVIRYENKKGKLHYTLINGEDRAQLGKKFCEFEVPLYQMGQYEKNRFR